MKGPQYVPLTVNLEAFDDALNPRDRRYLVNGAHKVVFIMRDTDAGSAVPNNLVRFVFGKGGL